MSKVVDLDKKLSDDDRAYLKERSRLWEIDENDRKFKQGKYADDFVPEFQPGYTVAAPPIEPGSEADNPPTFVGARPYGVDRGVWGGSTGLTEQEALAGNAGEPHSTQEEVEEVDVDELTVEQLKDELHALDLPVSGNKKELQDRLQKALEDQ